MAFLANFPPPKGLFTTPATYLSKRHTGNGFVTIFNKKFFVTFISAKALKSALERLVRVFNFPETGLKSCKNICPVINQIENIGTKWAVLDKRLVCWGFLTVIKS